MTTREILEGVRTAADGHAAILRIRLAVTRLAALAGDVGGLMSSRPSVINSRR